MDSLQKHEVDEEIQFHAGEYLFGLFEIIMSMASDPIIIVYRGRYVA